MSSAPAPAGLAPATAAQLHAHLTSARWFRAGDPWAWYTLWIFPLLCAWGIATTWAVALWALLLTITMAALLLSYRSFFRSPQT